MDRQLMNDVAAASAAYLLPELPKLARMPQKQAFEKLTLFLEATLMAYREGEGGWMPEPSQN